MPADFRIYQTAGMFGLPTGEAAHPKIWYALSGSDDGKLESLFHGVQPA